MRLLDNIFMVAISTLVWGLIAYMCLKAFLWLFNKADGYKRPTIKTNAKVTGKRIIPAHVKQVTDWDYEHDVPHDFEVEVPDKHILEVIINEKPAETSVTSVLYPRIKTGDEIPVYYSTGRITKKIVSAEPIWPKLFKRFPAPKTHSDSPPAA